MFHILPEEILPLIIQKIDIDPISIYNLRNINQQFKETIENFSCLVDISEYNINKTSQKITELCKKQTHLNTFKWLSKNKLFLDLSHINTLIVNNRVDVIRLCFFQKEHLNILFNRFYYPIIEQKQSDIFSITKSNNPLIMAAIHNRVSIVKLLIEICNHGNHYRKHINYLLDISIKYCHRNLLCYLIKNQYKVIFEDLQRKIYSIINRFDNCEDIFFYLVVTKKINITEKLLCGMIIKKYNELFIHCYPLIQRATEPNHHEYLKYCIFHSNKEIFTYLLTIIIIDDDFKRYITNSLLQKKNAITKDFLTFLLREKLSVLEKHPNIIYICIQHKLENQDIMTLVNQGFPYDLDDIQVTLDQKNIPLLKYLVHHFKE
tara:strand:- start:87 stop:1214 length:1128 start_codon:yes stop_codon:yes gene_type:complete